MIHMFTTLVTRPEPSTTRQMETKAASASCRSRTAIAWVVLFVSQMHETSAFSSLGLIRNARALPVSPGSQSKVVDSGRTRIFRSVDVSGCRNMGQQDSSNKEQDGSTNEAINSEDAEPTNASHMTDTEFEELLKGLNIGSSGKASSKGRGELDEMKLIMALRKQMGEEDFYQVFDPRNPRIGDL